MSIARFWSFLFFDFENFYSPKPPHTWFWHTCTAKKPNSLSSSCFIRQSPTLDKYFRFLLQFHIPKRHIYRHFVVEPNSKLHIRIYSNVHFTPPNCLRNVVCMSPKCNHMACCIHAMLLNCLTKVYIFMGTNSDLLSEFLVL